MTTPRDDIAGRETHTVHDPFLKRDVEVSSKLPDRLRGKYAKGPTMPDGEPEFGWSQFETPPIQHEAADALDVAATQLDSLLKERFKLITDLADMKSRAISAEQERDALQAERDELRMDFDHAMQEFQIRNDELKAAESRADALQARVKLLEGRIEEIGVVVGHSINMSWPVIHSVENLRNRATSLQQERDEAYERAEKIITSWWAKNHPPVMKRNSELERAIAEILTAIRRLAGPEKEKS